MSVREVHTTSEAACMVTVRLNILDIANILTSLSSITSPFMRRRPRLFWLGTWLTIPRLAFGAAVLCLGIWLWTSRETRSPHDLIVRHSPRTNAVVRPPRPASAPLPALSLLSMSRAWNESDATLDQLLAREEKILLAGDPPIRAWN